MADRSSTATSPAGERVFLVPSGYNFRAVLAFCRALRQNNQPLFLIACTHADPIFRTAYGSAVVHTRAQQDLLLDEFVAAIAQTRRASGGARCVLAPCSEFLIRWAFRHRREFERAGCDLPLPDESVYLRVTEKELFATHCRELGLAVPATRQEPTPPCVAKPRRNVSAAGVSLYPWLIETAADAAAFCRTADRGEFFFQEWIQGRSYYLLFHLPRNGRAVAYSQENLCQQPAGKSIVFAKSATLHRTNAAATWEAALRACGFHGLVMVEFRRDGDRDVMIEANPRLWGPLQLCVDGCPQLLASYIAEQTGSPVVRSRAESHATYLWTGGMSRRPLAWHAGAPLLRNGAVFGHLFADVYLKTDSWRQFVHEHRLARHSPSAPVSSNQAAVIA